MKTNIIYNEDCIKTMQRIEDKSIDYVLTSPPYNVRTKRIAKYKEFKDNLSQEQYFEEQKELIENLLRITKNHIFYNIQMISGNKIALHRLFGYFAKNIKEVLIWSKGFGAPAISEKVFNSAFEYIIIFSNNEPEKRYFKDANFDRGSQSNIFEILNSHSNQFAKVHKAVMPLDIPRYFMINFGLENDIWFDPYMGTGTTALSALMEKRQFIGSEIYKEYFDISNKRISDYKNQLQLF